MTVSGLRLRNDPLSFCRNCRALLYTEIFKVDQKEKTDVGKLRYRSKALQRGCPLYIAVQKGYLGEGHPVREDSEPREHECWTRAPYCSGASVLGSALGVLKVGNIQ